MIDYESFEPNLKALRRIMAALIVAAVITFGIAVFLIVHPPHHPRVTRAAPRCACKGAGICCPRPSPLVKAGN
jgi:hypothetical protein